MGVRILLEEPNLSATSSLVRPVDCAPACARRNGQYSGKGPLSGAGTRCAAFWLTAATPASHEMANTCEKRLSLKARQVELAGPGRPGVVCWGQLSQTLLAGTHVWLTATVILSAAMNSVGFMFPTMQKRMMARTDCLSRPGPWPVSCPPAELISELSRPRAPADRPLRRCRRRSRSPAPTRLRRD